MFLISAVHERYILHERKNIQPILAAMAYSRTRKDLSGVKSGRTSLHIYANTKCSSEMEAFVLRYLSLQGCS